MECRCGGHMIIVDRYQYTTVLACEDCDTRCEENHITGDIVWEQTDTKIIGEGGE